LRFCKNGRVLWLVCLCVHGFFRSFSRTVACKRSYTTIQFLSRFLAFISFTGLLLPFTSYYLLNRKKAKNQPKRNVVLQNARSTSTFAYTYFLVVGISPTAWFSMNRIRQAKLACVLAAKKNTPHTFLDAASFTVFQSFYQCYLCIASMCMLCCSVSVSIVSQMCTRQEKLSFKIHFLPSLIHWAMFSSKRRFLTFR